MKALAINKQTLWYSLCTGKNPVYDANGLLTGEYKMGYATPVKAKMNISPANGRVAFEAFGIATNYDKTIVTDKMDCPIAEDTVLWIGIEPTSVVNGTTVNNPYNFVVNRVAKSLNSIVYGVTEVSVGESPFSNK